MKKYYITTPIYYPSGRYHIGTTYTEVVADSLKRYKKLKGYDSYMLTGADEHGQKIQEVAEKNGETPKQYVDKMADMAKTLWKKMDIQYDDFIRTTDERHEKTVQKIFDKFMEQGDIYKGEYEGWYCVPCETFFTETQLKDGKCPDCGRDVSLAKEEAYFFNMKKYADKLLKYYDEHPHFIKPDYRKSEMINNFIKPGLEDLCVTRTTFDWGIKTLKDPKHVIYVWLDALTNYITALGYMSEDETLFNKYWPADVQVVGKDIARFHLIYWPIFLMALDLPLPKQILVHNWIMMKDGKMSKSKGNVIYPETLIDRYGLDALKYYLLKQMPVSTDGVFTPEEFIQTFNVDLCNDLGNLLNRTIAMCNKYFDGKVPEYKDKVNDVDEEVEETAIITHKKLEEKLDEFEFSNALQTIWLLISRSNKYIDETSPWALAKQDDEKSKEKLQSTIYHLIENLRRVGIMLLPFMPDTANNILNQLGIKDDNLKTWESLESYDLISNLQVISKGEPLFMRLNVDEEMDFIKNNMGK